MIKLLKRLGIQGFNIITIKAVYGKPMANIKLNEEKDKEISLKSIREIFPLSPYLFNIVLEFLARIGKEVLLFADDMILNTNNGQTYTRDLQE